MNKTIKALGMLKRNLFGTILLAFILPVYTTEVLKEDPKTIGIIASVMIWLSIINLSYTNRVEKALKEEAIENSDTTSRRSVN